jgi:hypothetical protein
LRFRIAKLDEAPKALSADKRLGKVQQEAMKFDLLLVQNRSRIILEDWLLVCSLGAVVVG